MATFKDEHEEFQHIVRELLWVREHNLKLTDRSPQEEFLHFTEGLLVLLALERFLRLVLGSEATESDTLPPLLQKATSEKRKLLSLPGRWSRDDAIKAIKDVRNTLMHGNYEQAASQSGSATVRAYFSQGRYIGEVRDLHVILDDLVRQIDPDTGKPITPA